MRPGNFAFFLSLLLLHPVLTGQEVQLSFLHLEQDAGLSPATNYLFSQDAQGFIWISTSEGLNRYDGRTIVKYAHDPSNPQSLSENLVTSQCFEDNNKDLWFTTFGNVQCYRRQSGVFESWSLPGSELKYYYAFHADSNGQLWLRIGSGEEASLYLFNKSDKTFTQKCRMEGDRCSVVLDNTGRPAFLAETQLPTRTGMIWRSLSTGAGTLVEFILQANGKPRAFPSPTNATLAESDTLVWVGVYNGLGQYQLKTGSAWVETGRLPGVPDDLGWVFGIVPLDEKHLLVSCSFGLVVFDRQKRVFTEIMQPVPKDPYSLLKGEHEELYADHSGNIWVSRTKQGVSFANLHKRKFRHLPQGSGSSVTTIFEDAGGKMWCSTNDVGTYIFSPEKPAGNHQEYMKNMLYPDEKQPLHSLKHIIQDSAGSIWGANDNTMLFWDKQAESFRFQEGYILDVSTTDADRLNHYCRLDNGKILAAKGREVFVFSTTRDKVKLVPWHDLSPFHLQIITAIFQDKKGRIFIGDQTEKLVVLKEAEGSLRLLVEMQNVGACNSFLEIGDTVILAATSKGLLRIQPENMTGRLLNEAVDGMPNEHFFNVLADKTGQIWLSGNNGLVRYNPQTKQYHRFSKADGLTSLSAGIGTFIARSNGEFWLGGKNGLNVFRPEAVKLLDTKPPVLITEIYVNDGLLSPKSGDQTIPLKLGYQDNKISFRFVVLDYSDPTSNQYFYRLEGFENTWVSNGNNDFVRFPNLPPGTYTFQVKATNSDGILNDAVASYRFQIHPPFWQTWWFYLLCVLIIAGFIYAWFQYRLQQALKIERMRVQISSDLHDDVGTLLAGLAMQSEALELTAAEKDKSKLQRISELSRNAMAHMRDTVWAIDARKDKLENLLDRMREHAEETLTPRDIRFDLQVENLALKQNLSTNIRQNIYLIFKEAVTNAAKHTNGDLVTVSLKRSVEGFEMRIFDNGTVIEKTYKTTGLGTSNMQMRAEKMGGTLEITRDNGFCVTLRMDTLR